MTRRKLPSLKVTVNNQDSSPLWIDIVPVAKPRMTRSDTWKQRPAVMRYRAFCDELRLKYTALLPGELHLLFALPMPASWSQKKRAAMDGQPHQQRPDLDNMVKSIQDALSVDDSYIYDLSARKIWAEFPGISIW